MASPASARDDQKRDGLPLDLLPGLLSKNRQERFDAADRLLTWRTPDGWSRELLGVGRRWYARAVSPDGRELRRAASTPAGALIALAKALHRGGVDAKLPRGSAPRTSVTSG